MVENNINYSIREYLKKTKYPETLKFLTATDGKCSKTLEKVFKSYYQKQDKTDNKLSFTYKFDTKQSLLKKQLGNLEVSNAKTIKKNVKITKKVTQGVTDEIPLSFFLLLDELCIDRKNARKFFENPDQWTYIKSD